MINTFVQQGQAFANYQPIKSIKYDKQYKILEQIGSGTEGIVYKGEEISSEGKEIVAIKLQRILNQQNIIQRFSEKKFKNLINVRDIITNLSGTYIIMDYADGEFFKYMQSQEYKSKSTREKSDLFIQIVQGVEELHEMKIIHRDLKPENILYIKQNGVLQLKLADFGLIKSNMEDPLKTANIGTPYYWAPEMISAQTYTNYADKIDIWALGMIWHEMITGKTMLQEFHTVQNIRQHLMKLQQNWINERVDKISELNPQEKQILKTNVLVIETNSRITAKQFKEKLIEIQNHQSGQSNSFLEINKLSLQQDKQQFLKLNGKNQFDQNQIPFKYQQQPIFFPQPPPNNPVALQFNQQQPSFNIKQMVPQNQSPFIINKLQISPFQQQQEQFNGLDTSFRQKGNQKFQHTQQQSIDVRLTIPSQSTIQVQNELQQTQLRLEEKQNEINLYKQEQEKLKQKINDLKNIFDSKMLQIESHLKQKENQTIKILSNLQKYLHFTRKTFNKKAIEELKYQIQQLAFENQNIKEQNKNLQKELKEKQKILNQTYQIQSQVQDKISEIQLKEKEKQSLEQELFSQKKNIDVLKNQIYEQKSDYQLQKLQLKQALENLNIEKNKLQQEFLEKDSSTKNLLIKLEQEQNKCLKIQVDLFNEKKFLLSQLIKFASQILQFQIHYSNNLKKINNLSTQENSSAKQYLEFLKTLEEQQKKQLECIEKNERELIGIRDNNRHQLDELFGSIQNILLDVSNNINKNYQSIKNFKFILKNQQEFSGKQKKKDQQIEFNDQQIQKQGISLKTLNQFQQSMQFLFDQIIIKAEDAMKLQLHQVMNLQYQFETEFYMAIFLINSDQKCESQEEIKNIFLKIQLKYQQIIENIKLKPLEIKTQQLQNDLESLGSKEIIMQPDELKNLEKSKTRFNMADIPIEHEEIQKKIEQMIQLINQFKQSEATEIKRAHSEYLTNYQCNQPQLTIFFCLDKKIQEVLETQQLKQNKETIEQKLKSEKKYEDSGQQKQKKDKKLAKKLNSNVSENRPTFKC